MSCNKQQRESHGVLIPDDCTEYGCGNYESYASPSSSEATTRDEFTAAAVAGLGWTEEQAGQVYDAMNNLTFADFDKLADRLGL